MKIKPIQPKAVIFDMDGVIINNNEWHLKAWLKYAHRLGIILEAHEFPTRVFGKTNEEILKAAFPEASEGQILQWSLEKEALYRELYQPHFQLAEGLLQFLHRLMVEEIPLAVASNAPKVNVDFALDEGNIRPFFREMLYYGIVKNPKPAPDIYLEACHRLGQHPNDCYVIEDSPTGLVAALAAGCHAISITSTFEAAHLETITPWVFPHFDDIGQFLFA